jgi:uncharacterized protein involved in outer membrane biogenesis
VTFSGTPRTVLVFALSLALGLGLAAAFAPRFVDVRALAPGIAADLTRALGREVTVRGEVFLSFVTGPQLIVRDIATRPFDGTGLALAADEARADLSWRELALGRYTVATLALTRPRIEARWGALGTLARALPHLKLADGRLALHGLAEPLVIDNVEAEIAPAGADALRWTLAGRLDGVPVDLSGRLGSADRTGARAAELSLKLPEADATLALAGVLDPAPAFKGRATVTALHAADVAALAGIAAAAQVPVLAQPLTLSADIAADAARLDLANGSVALADQTAAFSAAAAFDAVPRFRLSVDLTRIDVQPWLGLFAPAPPGAAVRPALGRAFAGAAPWTADITVNGPALRLGDQVLRDAVLALVRADGQWTVRNAAVTLPGQARMSFAGSWGGLDAGAALDGAWRAEVQDVRGLLAWLGLDAAAVPAGRLGSLGASGTVQAGARLVTLNDLTVAFDLTQARGRVAFGWSADAPLTVDLDIDRLALDVYGPLIIRAATAMAGPMPAVADQAAGYGVTALAPWLAGLAQRRGSLRIAVPQLTWRDELNGRLGIDLAFGEGVVDVRSLAVEDAAAAVWLGGKIRNLAGVPTAEGIQIDVKVADPVRLARAARAELSPLLRALTPWSLTGALNGSLLDATLAFDGKLGPLALTARGTAAVVEQAARLETDVTLTHPSVAAVREALWGRTPALPRLDGPFSAAARLTLTGRTLALDGITLAIGRGAARGKLTVDATTSPKTVTADFSDIDLDLAALLPGAPPPIPPPGDWQGGIKLAGPRLIAALVHATDFNARLTAGKNAVELAEWQGKLFGGPAQLALQWTKNAGPVDKLQGQVVIAGADPALMLDGGLRASRGKADLTLSFVAEADTPSQWLPHLTGAGSLRVTLPAATGLKAVGPLAPLAAVVGAETPGDQTTSPLDASARFAVAHGVVAVEDLSVAANAYRAQFAGRVDLLRRAFDLAGTLKLKDRGLIVGPTAQLVLPPTVPMRITGPIAAPTIALELQR